MKEREALYLPSFKENKRVSSIVSVTQRYVSFSKLHRHVAVSVGASANRAADRAAGVGGLAGQEERPLHHGN